MTTQITAAPFTPEWGRQHARAGDEWLNMAHSQAAEYRAANAEVARSHYLAASLVDPTKMEDET